MKHYVAGFMFNESMNQVALIKKEAPDWQKGKYNAIGGKIEPGETPIQAMVREFEEEAGLKWEDWENVVILKDMQNRRIVWFFRAFTNRVKEVKSMENEVVEVFDLTSPLHGYIKTLYNLKWLIPFCLDNDISQHPYTIWDES